MIENDIEELQDDVKELKTYVKYLLKLTMDKPPEHSKECIETSKTEIKKCLQIPRIKDIWIYCSCSSYSLSNESNLPFLSIVSQHEFEDMKKDLRIRRKVNLHTNTPRGELNG